MEKERIGHWAGMKFGTFDQVRLSPTVGEQDGWLIGGLAEPCGYPDFVRHQREGGPRDKPVKGYPAEPARLAGKYLYGGPLIGHFGHFIAECVHRLWLAAHPEYCDLPALLLADPGDAVSAAIADRILPALGLDNYVIVTEPVMVERLVVGEMGKSFRTAASAPYVDWLKANRPLAGYEDEGFPDKVCMLRGHLLGGKVLGEPAIEAWLVEEGYHAVRPEDHDLVTQLKYLVNARKLVFSEGSALHLLDLLPPIGAEIFVLQRRPFSQLAPTSLEGKCARATCFADVTPVLLPGAHIKGNPFDRNLVYAPLDAVAAELEAEGFVSAAPTPGLGARGAYLQGLLQYSNAVVHRMRDGTDMPRPEKVERMLADLLDATARKDRRYRREQYLRLVAEARLASLEGDVDGARRMLVDAVRLLPDRREAIVALEALASATEGGAGQVN